MSDIRACIFDLDGVIVDTARYHYQAWKRLAEELGFEFSEADNEQLKGVSRMESLDRLLKIGGLDLSEARKLELAEKKNGWYQELIVSMDPSEILPGVETFLDALQAANMPCAIASSSKNANTVLDAIGLLGRFDTVVDGTMIANAKPDPEIFLTAAKRLKMPPTSCAVFEDAASGIEAAKRAGMLAIGVGQPEHLPEADKVISGFESVNLDILNT